MTIPREKIISDESYIISRSDNPSVLLFHRIDGKEVDEYDLTLLRRLYNEMRVQDIIIPYEDLQLTQNYLLSYVPGSNRFVQIFLQEDSEVAQPKASTDIDARSQFEDGNTKKCPKKFGIIARLLHKAF